MYLHAMIVLTISSFSLGQTRQGSMSITIYEYARNLDSASNQRNDLTEIHMADIVSTTYDVLKEELSRDSDRHDGDRRFLRFQKG
jgi:E3 ubiquitin-protein ligase SHPRH